MIAGLIADAVGTMVGDMLHALHERRDLIETHADAMVTSALTQKEPGTA